MADHRTIARHARILPEPIFDHVSQQCVKTEFFGYFGILHYQQKKQIKSSFAIATTPPPSKYVPVPHTFRIFIFSYVPHRTQCLQAMRLEKH